MRSSRFVFLLGILCGVSVDAAPGNDESTFEVVSSDQLEWGYLNPARGDNGPAAADLWGDRTKDSASGILLQFPGGFSSPPHIHNISYRGLVISGELHNDDPAAAEMWMPSGSFWVQPAGEAHITAAKGKKIIAYIEIDSGPYLVQSTEDAFDGGERPLNVDPSNIVWLGADEAVSVGNTGVEIAYLWGKPGGGGESGSLLKIPPGFDGAIILANGSFRAVVISGDLQYKRGDGSPVELRPGSYWGSTGGFDHGIFAGNKKELLLYVRSSANFEIKAH